MDEGVLQQTKQIVNQTQKSLMQSYVRHKHYYDKKANPLVVNDNCYALHPKRHSQTTKLRFGNTFGRDHKPRSKPYQLTSIQSENSK